MIEPIIITDLDDPRIEPFRDVRDKDLRGRTKLFMAESELVLRRLLRTPERIHSILLSPLRFEQLREALGEIETTPDEAKRPVVYVAELDLMTRIAGFHIHRGVLAAGYRPSRRDLALEHALGHLRPDATDAPSRITLLICEGLTNVDNMGSIFRNAAAFGVQGVALDPTCCDPLYRKAIRVATGHSLSVPWAVCADWPGDLERLKREWGMTLIGAEVTADAAPLWEIPRADRLAIMLGSESDGLSDAALAACDRVCRIPMAGAPSINVSAACSVFLYERNRPA